MDDTLLNHILDIKTALASIEASNSAVHTQLDQSTKRAHLRVDATDVEIQKLKSTVAENERQITELKKQVAELEKQIEPVKNASWLKRQATWLIYGVVAFIEAWRIFHG